VSYQNDRFLQFTAPLLFSVLLPSGCSPINLAEPNNKFVRGFYSSMAA
jgi:hypothetical protein